ncbi:transglutaminase domain-containing protein [Patescibacteria group bacterium]|nr:transglutaminase domain-containing protein [Patescibacteria group bacterium]
MKARRIMGSAQNPVEIARAVFLFVRDHIRFGLDRADRAASETLERSIGFCVNKANLQVALLRAAGLPARFHQVILTKNCLNGIFPAAVLARMPSHIWYHPWCECQLRGQWLSCEALYDKPLFRATLATGIFNHDRIPSIEWDGEHDLRLMTSWLLEDRGTHAELDAIFVEAQAEQPPSLLGGLVHFLTNRHIASLRRRAKPEDAETEAEQNAAPDRR